MRGKTLMESGDAVRSDISMGVVAESDLCIHDQNVII